MVIVVRDGQYALHYSPATDGFVLAGMVFDVLRESCH